MGGSTGGQSQHPGPHRLNATMPSIADFDKASSSKPVKEFVQRWSTMRLRLKVKTD
jgi:hypothetical protein